MYDSALDYFNNTMANSIKKAVADAGIVFESTQFAKDISDVLNFNGKENAVETMRELSEMDTDEAIVVMSKYLGNMISENYANRLLEVIENMHLSHKDDSSFDPTTDKTLNENPIGIVLEDEGDLASAIELVDKREHSAYVVVEPVLDTELGKSFMEYMTSQGAAVASSGGIVYFSLPNKNTKKVILENLINDSGIVSADLSQLKQDKVVQVSISNTESVDVNNSVAKIKNNKSSINTLIELAKNNKDRIFYINTSNKSFISKLARNIGLPENIVFNNNIASYARKEAEISKRKAKDTVTVSNELNLGKHKIDLKSLGIDFTLTDEQTKTLQNFAAWIEGTSDKAFMVEGLAGTGKTTIIKVMNKYMQMKFESERDAIIAEDADPEKLKSKLESELIFPVFTASTRIAAINLSRIIGKPAMTAHSFFSVESYYDDNNELKFEDSVNQIPKNKVVFIDEFSMLSEPLTKAMIESAKEGNSKIILFGNSSQFDQPKQKSNEIWRDKSSVILHRLTEVKRQNTDNPAVPLYRLFAGNQDKDYGYKGLFRNVYYNDKTKQGLVFTTDYNNFINKAVAAFKHYSNNPLGVRVLALSNEKVSSINNEIRKRLIPDASSSDIHEGDILVANDSMDYIPEGAIKNMQYVASNVKHTYKEISVGAMTVKIPVIEATLNPVLTYTDANGKPLINSTTVTVLDHSRLGNALNNPQSTVRIALEQHAKNVNSAKFAYINAKKSGAKNLGDYKDEYVKLKDSILTMKPIKFKSKKGFDINAVPAHFSYAYATTAHKAQGLEFDSVFLDENNAFNAVDYNTKNIIKKNPGKAEELMKDAYKQYNKFVYVGLTRGKNIAVVYTNKRRTTSDSESDIQKRVADRNSNLSFENKRVNENFTGTSHYLDNLAGFIGNKRNAKVAKIDGLVSNSSDVFNNKKRAALAKIAPSDFTYNDETDPVISSINDELYNSLAVSEDSSMIPADMDMDSYNLVVYDRYQRKIMDVMYDKAFGNEYDSISFEIKKSNVHRAIDEDLDSLGNQLNSLQDNDGSVAEINTVLNDISQKRKLKNSLNKSLQLSDLLEFADKDLKKVEEILARTNITTEDLNLANSIVDRWISAGDFADSDGNVFLSESEVNDEGIRAIFSNAANKAADLKSSLDKLSANLLVSNIGTELNDRFSFMDLTKLKTRVGWLFKKIFSTARIDNPIIGYITKLVNSINDSSVNKAIAEGKLLSKLYSKLQEIGFDRNLFFQRSKGGGLTGRLVSEHTYEYQNLLHTALNTSDGLRSLREHSIIIDLDKLLKIGEDAYISELVSSGEITREHAENAISDASAKLERYFNKRDTFLADQFGITFDQLSTLNNAQKRAFRTFDSLHNPITRSKNYNNKRYKSVKKLPGDKSADQFITIIPKSSIKMSDGTFEETDFYDEAFDIIKSSPEAYEFWKEASRITNLAKDNFNDDSISGFALSYMDSSLLEAYNNGGFAEVTKSVKDKFIDKFTTRARDLDYDVDGVERKVKLKANSLEQAIKNEYYRLIHEDYADYDIDSALSEQIWAEASNNVTKNMDLDIFTAISNIHYDSINYSYKRAIQPQIDLALSYIDKVVAGDPEDPNSARVSMKDVENAKEMIQFFLDRNFYGIKTQDKSYKLSPKVFNRRDRIRKEQIFNNIARLEEIKDELIREKAKLDPDDDKTQIGYLNRRIDGIESRVEQYSNELETLGSYVTLGKLVDSLIDYNRLLTIGWNISGFVANYMVGFYSNAINAASGKFYTFGDLMRAFQEIAGNKVKFDNVMSSYSILGNITELLDETYRVYDPKETDNAGILKKVKKFADPFYGMQLTEKYNQGTLAVAIMLNQTVVNKDTMEVVSFWDALDSNGILSDKYEFNGKSGADAMNELVQIINAKVAEAHGDYKSKIMAADTVGGRAVIQFKRYFFEPFLARFGAERKNYQSGETTKGWYLSVLNLFQKYGVDYNKFRADLANGDISEVDMSNLRKVFVEITAIVISTLLAKLTKFALCDDDEPQDCKGAKNWSINLMNRVASESKTFVNPLQWKNFISNPVAATKYLDILEDIYDNATSDSEQKTNTLLYTASRTTPGSNALRRENLYTEKVVFK